MQGRPLGGPMGLQPRSLDLSLQFGSSRSLRGMSVSGPKTIDYPSIPLSKVGISSWQYPKARPVVNETTHTMLQARLLSRGGSLTPRNIGEGKHALRPAEMLRPRELNGQGIPLQARGLTPKVTIGIEFTCGKCHGPDRPLNALGMPQQPRRVAPPPELFALRFPQQGRQAPPAMAARVPLPAQPARAMLPPPLLAVLQAPMLPPPGGILIRRPEMGRVAAPEDTFASRAAKESMMPPQGRVVIDPFAPDALDRIPKTLTLPSEMNVTEASPLPPSRGNAAQRLWPAPVALVAPRPEQPVDVSVPLELVFEEPPLPPAPGAILPPPPVEESAAEPTPPPSALELVALPPPLPSRVR